MTDKISIQQNAKAELLNHLEKLHCTVTDERQILEGEFLSLKSSNGIRHYVFIQLLNLDEARSIKIPQSVFDYEIRKGQWILLVLYMADMKPLSYLIPTEVFKSPNDIFLNNEQKQMFRHLSNWEIKVFRNAIPELSRFALDSGEGTLNPKNVVPYYVK